MHIERSLFTATAGVAPADLDMSGKWKNELKSTMTLVQNGSTLSGDYQSEKTDDPGVIATGPICGFVRGSLISFTVRWNEFDAITSWVGQWDPAQNNVETLWQMTKIVGSPAKLWESINAGADTFIQV